MAKNMDDSMKLTNFHIDEFKCKCGCQGNNIKPELLRVIDNARGYAMTPFTITSGYRCPRHNKSIGGVDDSAHVRGYAADIHVPNSGACYKILRGVFDAGFNRIGVYDTFIHVDVDPQKPPCVVWRKHG